jgi:predicted HTH transcriptional regulator
LIGVDNKGKITGVSKDNTPQNKDEISQRIRGILGKIKPKPQLNLDYYCNKREIKVAIITIPKSNRVHMFNDKIYIRKLDECRPAEPNDVDELYQSRRKTGK